MAQVAQIGASHTLRVTRLYRASLKNLMNWTVWRELWIEKGFELRAKFDANKHITDPRKIEKLLSAGEAELKALAHPDPYTRARPAAPALRGRPRRRLTFARDAAGSSAHAGRQQVSAPPLQQPGLSAGGAPARRLAHVARGVPPSFLPRPSRRPRPCGQILTSRLSVGRADSAHPELHQVS
jgi:hypothetical protein